MAGAHRVTLSWPDGREERVAADPGETVLEAAERAGVGLPFGCRTGACASCCGRVETVGGDADIAYRRPPRALKPRHREAGFVLCCVARPLADLRIAVGANVRADLVGNPWL